MQRLPGSGVGDEPLPTRAAGDLKPDLILLDIGMPGMNGIQALKSIKSCCQDVKVLILTQYAIEDYLFEVLRSGASGYVLTETACDELLSAIRTVNSGQAYLSPRMTRALVQEFLSEREQSRAAISPLTPREDEVLRLLAEGLSSQEIADRLCISLKIVQTHRSRIMEKLNLHSVVALVKYAIRKGGIPWLG